MPEEVVTDGVEQKSIRALMRDLLEIVCPQIQFSCLRPATSNRIEELLTKIDEQVRNILIYSVKAEFFHFAQV